ncbi:MAG TPA: MazG nucleotide pyrophosphohydrolase domain-containing protein [Acidimicrobiales bacterium]|nr:MazG nucleotide pyrophosphohydrolase domain-containing protein [Acidimicrobiales bacterium]
MSAVVRVVGLGPGDAELLTARSARLIRESPVVRFRTRRHPAADAFGDVESYDDLYERAASFEDLYRDIVADLVALARQHGEVLYVVPGSPVVAERTVELLAEADVDLVLESAVSVIDVACARLGRDPMAGELRVVDALASSEPLRGPGPLLVLQTYSREVLALVASRLPATSVVTVLHHLGLDDEEVRDLPAGRLATFDADHLTSLWVEAPRGAGAAIDDLVDFARTLRRECPWDAEQNHASLTRHLLEESYEALDAIEAMVHAGDGDLDAVAHVEEELGDLLDQIVFHAELGDEEGLFSLATIADGVRDKLTGRHPHVFGDVIAASAEDVVANWETLKRAEKSRESALDGVLWQLPALRLYSELADVAARLGVETPASDDGLAGALVDIVERARRDCVDLEGVLRQRALALAAAIRTIEGDTPRDAVGDAK